MAGHANAASGGLSEQESSNVHGATVDDPGTDVGEGEQRQNGANDRERHEVAAEIVTVGVPSTRAPSPIRLGAIVGSAAFIALAGLLGRLGYEVHQEHHDQAQREMFVQTARQAALNLTTIDWQKADADVQRIVDSATGTFQTDFSQRSQPFVAVVKQVKSTSVGTITESALESTSGDEARVIVVASVKTTMPDQPDAQPKHWRMRISLQKVNGSDIKISNVAFI